MGPVTPSSENSCRGTRAVVSEAPSYPEAGFARLAGDFIRAARLVAGKDDAALESEKGFFPLVFPFLFLIGHALELAYKAVLLVDGATESDLKRFGHDLMKCRQKVQVCCPGRLESLEEPGTEEIVRRIDPYYKAKAFEYHMMGLYWRLPASPHQVVTISAGTVKNIQDWVQSSVRQRIRDARNGA